MANIYNTYRVETLPTNRPLSNGDQYILKKPNGRFEVYIVDPQGELRFNKGITDDQNTRLERMSSEQISKVESITSGDITKLKQDYTKAEIDQQFKDVRNFAKSSRINLNGSTILPVPPRRPDNTVIEDAWVRLAQNVTYTQAGGSPLTGIDGHETVAEWNNEDGEWVLVDMGELPSIPVDGVVEEENTQAVSGGEVYDKLLIEKPNSQINLINPDKIIWDRYYSQSSKTIISNSANNFVCVKIPVEEGETYVFSHQTVNLGTIIAGYLTSESATTAIENVVGTRPAGGYGWTFTVPTGLGITHIVLDLNTTDTSHTALAGNYQLEKGSVHTPYTPYVPPFSDYIKEDLIPNSVKGISSNWLSKRITWCGTSIPAGQPKLNDKENFAYPNIIARRLGAIINNISVPSSTIRSTKSDGSPIANPLLAFTNLSSPINYQNSIVDKLLTEESPDLIVFDFGVNDYVQDKTDIDAYESFDMTTENTNTFLGSFNTVIKAILSVKPTQRIAICTHFTDASMTSGVSNYSNLNKAIQKLCAYWEIPCSNHFYQLAWHRKNGLNILGVMCPDGIHPASMSTNFSVLEIERNLEKFIEKC